MITLHGKSHLPLISVVVPIFNTERFIEKCLNSITNQTYRNIEIITVDDKSPDRSVTIVDELMKKDDRITLIRHQNNLGLGGARNTAIRAASGDWISFVDSDDFIEPDMINALYEGTVGGRFEIVTCGFDRVNDTGAVLSSSFQLTKKVDLRQKNINLFEVANPAFWNKLYRRELFTEGNIFFRNICILKI